MEDGWLARYNKCIAAKLTRKPKLGLMYEINILELNTFVSVVRLKNRLFFFFFWKKEYFKSTNCMKWRWYLSKLSGTVQQPASTHMQQTICVEHFCCTAQCSYVHIKCGCDRNPDLDGRDSSRTTPGGWETAADHIRSSSMDKPLRWAARRLWLPLIKNCVRLCVWARVCLCLLYAGFVTSECQGCYVNQWLAPVWESDV